jgi:hypothetical protein
MSDFITNFIENKSINQSKEDTLLFLENVEKTNAYFGGEYIINILHKINNDFIMTLYIHWSNFLDFIILSIDNIYAVEIQFETIHINTYMYVTIYTKFNFIYHIYIVPDDINITEYIKKRSITTLSEIWFYENKLKGTNLILSMKRKGYLKKEYLNLFIDNLDKIIINTLKYYAKNECEIIINTSTYTNKEEIEYKNKEEKAILAFLSYFYLFPDILEKFYNEISKIKYSNLATFEDNIILFHRINFILAISSNNTYNLDNLKDIFYNIREDNYSKLIAIIEELIEKDEYNIIDIRNYLKYLVEKIKMT